MSEEIETDIQTVEWGDLTEPRNLLQYLQEETWLKSGLHSVTVQKVQTGTNSNGTPYLDVWFEDGAGRKAKNRFYTVEQSRWVLSNFALCLGFTPEQIENICWNDFIGKDLQIYVKRNERDYFVVSNWYSKDAELDNDCGE